MIRFLLATTAVIVMGAATSVYAVTLAANATATIKKALTITQVVPMAFATVAAPPAGGTVTISSAGVIAPVTGFSFTGTPTASNFTVTGDPSTAVILSFANGSLTGPGTAMTLQNFTSNPAIGSVSTGAGGTVDLKVGADLIVGSNQTSGSYAGTYNVTVSY